MGLRFRKSVTLCKGVKLNFGKSGTSITFGHRGYHKTISSTGRVTTTIGIPGTGIYYTDTKQLGKDKRYKETKKNIHSDRKSKNERERIIEPVMPLVSEQVPADDEVRNEMKTPVFEESTQYLNRELLYQNDRDQHEEDASKTEETVSLEEETPLDYETNKNDVYNITFEDLIWSDLIEVHNPDIVVEHSTKEDPVLEESVYFTAKMIKEIYTSCDQTILWDDINLGAGAVDLFMSYEKWDYCNRIAKRIVSKDIEAYLKVIEDLKPVDDLLLYGGEFEFGTDDGHYLETEFKVFPEDVLEEGKQSELLSDYIFAVSLRVARDLMATLPIDVIIIHAVIEGVTLLSVAFERSILENIDFRNRKLIQITSLVPMRLSNNGEEVERIGFDTYKNVPVLEIPEEFLEKNTNNEEINRQKERN